jgi:hypothetical protein
LDSLGREWHEVVGKELDAYEVILKVEHGYQLHRFGWLWAPPDLQPRPEDLRGPEWQLVNNTQPTFTACEAIAAELPIIGGPVKVSEGAEIRRSTNP